MQLVQVSVDVVLRLQWQVHARQKVIVGVIPRFPGLSEKQELAGNLAAVSPSDRNPLLEEDQPALAAGNLRETVDVAQRIDVDEDIIHRMVEERDQRPENFRLIVGDYAVCVLKEHGYPTL